ncbi:MAG: ATP-binding protein [Actinophytocola sp.]|uniref:ATP-binding protein n=1 Tax=Actinophytocola sp. TaxID=1872138 RepID=UPI001327E138|nr:ATP-binding protein [Actinophytocola sp.]MPZ84187.1 ATP-binding protein [Actinophytocola sp.]
MHDQTAQVDDLRLVALPSAVNCADLFVRFTLTEWHVPSMLDDVADTAKKLVHAVIGSVVHGTPPTMMTVRLRLRGDAVAIEVEDDRPTPKLAVPRSLAGKRSGVTTMGRGRQLIWCELPLPTGMDATVVPLPRRGTTRAAPRRSAEIDDAADLNNTVMQRILDGLRKDDPTI